MAVIALMFRSFGLEPPARAGGLHRAMLWLLALCFVTVSAAILVVINVFSLLFGVSLNFLGRNGVKFHFLHLFGRIPLIGVTLPVLFGYAIWHNARMTGGMAIAYPSILTAGFAALLLGVIVLVNLLMSRRSDDR